MTALELIPGLPVPLLAMAALRTGAARVARIEQNDGDAPESRLVGDETPELMERPTLHAGSIGLSDRCPLADAFEVFEGDRAGGAFGLAHDPLRDDVILVRPEPTLLPTGLVEFPP